MIELGWHWIVDAFDCDGAALADRGALLRLLTDVPQVLGLRVVGEPQVHIESAPEPLLVGLVLLAESHFSVHARPAQRVLHADLFSCVRFDVERCLLELQQAYGFREHRAHFFERNLPAPAGEPT
ncbi:MAG: S-adenosylmethionine decarboxylase [Polyangiaceae bacterium]|nr:S-adenosylmethionine decarboxylase [Myxococcales bacterium]MCB9584410.1 S-adenosylmethionine decarboxylase [Polyangiaceae bacterium]